MRFVAILTSIGFVTVVGQGAVYGQGAPLCMGRTATIIGTDAPDRIYGTVGSDVIIALGGDDFIDGAPLGGLAGQPDYLCGGDGDDQIISHAVSRLSGGAGDDHFEALEGVVSYEDAPSSIRIEPSDDEAAVDPEYEATGWGRDTFYVGLVVVGSRHDDVILGSNSRTLRFRGAAGNDRIRAARRISMPLDVDGGLGNDVINGGTEPDVIRGGSGSDRINGWGRNDTLAGQQGNDVVLGGSGNDLVRGGAGRDRLDGGRGRDGIEGGTGDDLLFGGAAVDLLNGGNGRDRGDGGPARDRCVSIELPKRCP